MVKKSQGLFACVIVLLTACVKKIDTAGALPTKCRPVYSKTVLPDRSVTEVVLRYDDIGRLAFMEIKTVTVAGIVRQRLMYTLSGRDNFGAISVRMEGSVGTNIKLFSTERVVLNRDANVDRVIATDTIIDPSGTDISIDTTIYTYNANKHLVKTSNPSGSSYTAYEYAFGNQVAEASYSIVNGVSVETSRSRITYSDTLSKLEHLYDVPNFFQTGLRSKNLRRAISLTGSSPFGPFSSQTSYSHPVLNELGYVVELRTMLSGTANGLFSSLLFPFGQGLSITTIAYDCF